MKQHVLVGLFSVSLALSGCGGGSGGGGGNAPSRQLTPTEGYSSITGVYDASKLRDGKDDIGYLYISPEGVIEQYNDMNDAYAEAQAMNCYRRAITGDINAALDGKKLTDVGDGSFSVTLKGNTGVESTLVYRPKDGMLYATYDGATGSRLLLKKGVDGIPGPLILGGVAVTEPSIETIRSMICTE